MKETVYSPESNLRSPHKLLVEMLSDLLRARGLAWRLFVRNISAQYRQSVLGYFWAFLPPLATTLVWVFLNKQKILNVADTGMPYPVFVLTGTLLWQVFVEALNSPIKMVSQSKAMLAKINFPREALLLAGLGEVLLNFFIRIVLLVGVFIWFKVSVPATVFLAPLGVLSLILFGMTLGLLLTPIGMLYTDVARGIGIITQFWFFLTPIIYPAPASWPASLVAMVNPVSPLIQVTRDWLTTGHSSAIGGFYLVSAVTIIFLLAGWLLYRVAMPHLIERMSA